MSNIVSFSSYQPITTSQPDHEPTISNSSTLLQKTGSSFQRLISESNSTDNKAISSTAVSTKVPTSRLYPHVFDGSTDAGNMLIHLEEAISYTQHAIDSYVSPDLVMATSYLTNVANSMRLAYSYANFNKALRGLISFIRRSTLTTPIEILNLASLNALMSTLNSIISDPLLSFDEATDYLERLSENAWQGENAIVEAVISEMLDDSSMILENEHT